MKITIEQDPVTEMWHVEFNGITLKKKKLVDAAKALYKFIKGHPELDK